MAGRVAPHRAWDSLGQAGHDQLVCTRHRSAAQAVGVKEEKDLCEDLDGNLY